MTDPFEELLHKLHAEGNFEALLGNLLAVLNGDGGHYQEQFGTVAAILRGIDRYHHFEKRGT